MPTLSMRHVIAPWILSLQEEDLKPMDTNLYSDFSSQRLFKTQLLKLSSIVHHLLQDPLLNLLDTPGNRYFV